MNREDVTDEELAHLADRRMRALTANAFNRAIDEAVNVVIKRRMDSIHENGLPLETNKWILKELEVVALKIRSLEMST